MLAVRSTIANSRQLNGSLLARLIHDGDLMSGRAWRNWLKEHGIRLSKPRAVVPSGAAAPAACRSSGHPPRLVAREPLRALSLQPRRPRRIMDLSDCVVV